VKIGKNGLSYSHKTLFNGYQDLQPSMGTCYRKIALINKIKNFYYLKPIIPNESLIHIKPELYPKCKYKIFHYNLKCAKFGNQIFNSGMKAKIFVFY